MEPRQGIPRCGEAKNLKNGQNEIPGIKRKISAAVALAVILSTAFVAGGLASCTAGQANKGTGSEKSKGTALSANLKEGTETLDNSGGNEYALSWTDKKSSGEQTLELGGQTGEYPWGRTISFDKPAYSTPEKLPGMEFFWTPTGGFNLYYTADSGKEVLTALETSSPDFSTPRGIHVGDTLKKLLTAYDDGLLYQPNQSSVHTVFGRNRCVYDEIFIYTGKTEKNDHIIFYVADWVDEKTITCIEMGTGGDKAVFTADRKTTYPVDYNHLDSLLATDTRDETYIHSLFRGADTSAENTDKILAALPDINWRLYDELYAMSPDSHGGWQDIMNWLSALKISDDNHILSVLKATHGLDGALSESYAGVVAGLYSDDHLRFIRLLSRLDENQISDAAEHLVYGLIDKSAELETGLKEFLGGSDISEREKSVINEILEKINLIT